MVVETIGQAISSARPVGVKHRTPNKSLFLVKGKSFKVTTRVYDKKRKKYEIIIANRWKLNGIENYTKFLWST